MAPLRAQIMHMTRTLHTTDRELHYFYGARALNEVFYLDDFLKLEKDFPNFHFHLALDRPDPAADAAGVKYTPGFVHQVPERPRSSGRHRILHVWSWSDVESCCRYAG